MDHLTLLQHQAKSIRTRAVHRIPGTYVSDISLNDISVTVDISILISVENSLENNTSPFRQSGVDHYAGQLQSFGRSSRSFHQQVPTYRVSSQNVFIYQNLI
jgi:hypothetical protein